MIHLWAPIPLNYRHLQAFCYEGRFYQWVAESGEGECLHIEKGKKEEKKKKLTPSMKSSLDLNIYTCGHTCSRKFSSCVKFFSPANSSLNLEISCRQRDSESEYRKCQEKGQATSKCRGRQKRVSFGPTPTSKNGHRATDAWNPRSWDVPGSPLAMTLSCLF